MRLYDSPVSANCYKVRLLAANLGLELERVPVDIFTGEAGTDEHLARNPAGRTPVLELDSGEHLPESGAILLFLAEGTPLLPTDRVRAGAGSCLDLLRAEPARAEHRHGPLLAPHRPGCRERGPARALARHGREGARCARAAAGGDAVPARRAYSVADIALYAYTHVAPELGLDLGRFPAVTAWLRRVEEQPRLPERPRAVPATRRCRRRLGPRLSRGLVGPAEREVLLGGA